MPRTKSAKKALRQSARRRVRNIEGADNLKATVKNYKKLLLEGKLKEAEQSLSSVYKLLDKSANKNLIKKNKASRMKSRFSRQLKTKSSKTSS
ncbi:MAG: 30S ribosomal protein S20 [Patescibacteria group bacterium]